MSAGSARGARARIDATAGFFRLPRDSGAVRTRGDRLLVRGDFRQEVNYPLNVGGKPYFAWQTFLVVIMETGLLLGALANMGIALHLCRLLPDPNTRLINDRITDDTFALVLPVTAGKDAEGLSSWLRAQGAEEVQVIGVLEPTLVEEPAHA